MKKCIEQNHWKNDALKANPDGWISSLTSDSNKNLVPATTNAGYSDATTAHFIPQQYSTVATTSTESDAPACYNGAASTATAEASVTVSDFITMLQSNGPFKVLDICKEL